MRMSSTVNSCEAVGELMITRSHVTGTRLHHLHTTPYFTFTDNSTSSHYSSNTYILHYFKTESHDDHVLQMYKVQKYYLTSVVQIIPLFYYLSWKPTLFRFSTNYEKSDFNIIVQTSVEDFRYQHFKYIIVWLSSNMIFLQFWAY